MIERLTYDRQIVVDDILNAAAHAFGDLVAAFEKLLDTHELTAAHKALFDQIKGEPASLQWMLTVAVGREAIRRQLPVSDRADPETGCALPAGVEGHDPHAWTDGAVR